MINKGQTVAVNAHCSCDAEMRITTLVRANSRGLSSETQEEMQSIVFQILLEADVLQISKLKGELVALSTRVRASSDAEVQLLQMTYDDCPCQNELGGEVVVNVSW